MSSSWHHILAISPAVHIRVGDNIGTVNTSTTRYISDQLGTRNACKILLRWFIVMIWVPVCNNMYRYERHFGFFYRNPTILETVNGSTQRKLFYWMCATIWDVEQIHFHPFLQVSQIFKQRKSDANKLDFEMKLNLTWDIKLISPQNNRDLKQKVWHLLVQIRWS